MRSSLVWMALWGLGLTACGSDRPRAVAVPGGGAPGMQDAAAGGSTGASDSGEAAAIPAGPRPVKASPGCGKGNRAEGIQYIMSGGIRMLVTVRLPAGHDPDRPTPMGVAFPADAYPQCTVRCWGFTDLPAITVFPMTRTLSWDQPEESRQINFLFFEDIVAFVKNEYCVDENRMFVAGAGVGARFVQQLACKHGDGLWQIAQISAPGPQLDPTCQGRPAALVIHSVEDNGADVGQAVVENLAARNGCSATPPSGLAAARAAMLAAYRANRAEAHCVDWTGCARPVRLCLVSNRAGDTTQGSRGWPMSGGALIGEFLDRLD
jgi:hypothetical protein